MIPRCQQRNVTHVQPSIIKNGFSVGLDHAFENLTNSADASGVAFSSVKEPDRGVSTRLAKFSEPSAEECDIESPSLTERSPSFGHPEIMETACKSLVVCLVYVRKSAETDTQQASHLRTCFSTAPRRIGTRTRVCSV